MTDWIRPATAEGSAEFDGGRTWYRVTGELGAELDSLLDQLQLSGDHHLLGQWWGGMLASEHAVRRPAGLRRLVIAH
jgi:pimeloyl-ACP methyl ester carboxylesterase